MDLPSGAEQAERPYISTGHLPEPEMAQSLVSEAHRRFNSDADRQNSQVYPAFGSVPSDSFGLCVVATTGRVYGAGDIDYEFSIMSVSKPFVFALVCETIGPEEARDKFGANATTEARLRALKIGLLITAGLALLAIIPAGLLPDYVAGEVPSGGSARSRST
jgi:glutaminase